jgi:uncharacterized membrane protein YfcA
VIARLADPIFASHAHLIATLGAALVIGALIGSIGIGGILLSPWLIGVVGLDVRAAITISSASFIATGLAALVMFARIERADLARGWPLILATLPGAFVGAVALGFAPKRLSLAVLATLLIATGLRVLAGRTRAAQSRTPTAMTSTGADCAVGAIGGFVSALTGTGGPMVLVPIQLWRGVPLLAAVAIGQIVQLPIAAMATAGNVMSGGVDLVAAAAIGVVLVPGVVAGRRLAAIVPLALLTRVVAVLLVALGVWFALEAAGVYR